MTLELGTNLSPDEAFDKNVTYHLTLTGSLKNETSVSRPVILVESQSNLSHINYMRIPEFGRCYFTKITVVRNNLYEIEGKCDVLSSFKSQIRSNSAIIKKQESKYNLYLDDGSFKAYQNDNISILNFGGSTPFGSSYSYILSVAGD